MTLEEAVAEIKKLQKENRALKDRLDNLDSRVEKYAGQATHNFEEMDKRVKKLE